MTRAAILAATATIAACAVPATPPAVVDIGARGAAPVAVVSTTVAPPSKPRVTAVAPISWESSMREAEARMRRGHPMIVWARADWAAAAAEMERSTWVDPRVAAAARGFVALRLDLTDIDHPDAEMSAQRYRITRMPMTVILDAHGARRREITGFVAPEVIVAALAEVAE